jgi:cell wall-associated NlpC family hydrolase
LANKTVTALYFSTIFSRAADCVRICCWIEESDVPSPGDGTSLSSIQQQIRTQSAALEKIVEQYNAVTILLAKNRAAAQALQKRIQPTEAAYTVAQKQVASIAMAAYEHGSAASMPSSLTAIVASNNADDMAGGLALLAQVASARQKQLAGFQQIRATYQTQSAQLSNVIAQEAAQQRSLTTQRATINKKLSSLYALRAKAYGSATESGGGSHAVPPYIPGRGGAVVKFAYAQLGKPYSWAADGPGSYDCSGLTMAAYRSVGVSLPHNAAMQWDDVHHISRSELSPGDLVFYESLGHVAIYIGSGKIIHAPTFGEVVKIASITTMTPYGYGRP